MIRSDQPDRAATARLLGIVAALYLIFVCYGSWVPLGFTYRPFSEALRIFSELPFSEQSIESATDWSTNFILLIPLTFLCAQLFLPTQRGLSRLLGVILIFAFGIAVAFFLEFSQLYFPPRTVSQKDILALSLGAVVGVIAQQKLGDGVERWLDRLWQNERSKSRLSQLLHVYLLVFFVFSVLPLDLTISVVEIYHKWNEGRLVLLPFGGLKGGVFDNLYETITDLLVWVPVGVFLALDRRPSLLRVAGIAWLAAAIIEIAQIFVYSRVTDVTDVVLAGFGAAIGAWMASHGTRLGALMAGTRARFWYSLWCVWAVVVLCIFWFPYNFRTEGVFLEAALAALTRLPFLMLYQGSEFQAVNEMLRKLGFFLPGGIIWGVAVHKGNGSKGKAGILGVLALVSLAFVVEIGQLFLPMKFADFTDVLIMTSGGVLGLKIAQWMFRGYGRNHWILANLAQHESSRLNAVNPHSIRESVSVAKWNQHLVTFAVLILSIATVTHLPFVPYNVRELIEPGIYGVFSVIGLSLAIQWLVNGHFMFLNRCNRIHGQMLYLPFWLIVHGAVTWTLLRLSVPMESIHDIVGAPVLGWIWEWELIGRYLSLHGAIALQIIGATVLLGILCDKYRLELFLTWIIWSSLLAWPIHWIVVTRAATDNLTELMLGGGTFASSTLLVSGLFLFFLAAAAISNSLATRLRFLQTLLLSGAALMLSIVCFWYGTEQVIVKYGKVFSAWQFVLSPNRENYVSGARLSLHFALAFGTFLCLWALVQVPCWKTLAAAKKSKFQG